MGGKAIGVVTTKPCKCVRDVDGQCNPCKAKMQSLIKRFSDLVQRLMKEIREIPKSFKGMCQPCGMQYLDMAAAGIISSTPYVSLEGLMVAVKQMKGIAHPLGITAMPLTDRAAMEVAKSQGWTIPE